MAFCRNPVSCKKQSASWQRHQESANGIEKGELKLDDIREALKNKIDAIVVSRHYEVRSLNRSFNRYEIMNLIKEHCWVFEYYKNQFGNEKLGLMGYLKISEGKYRPVHIILKTSVDNPKWKIITVYDPRTEDFRWDKNHTVRKCFCNK